MTKARWADRTEFAEIAEALGGIPTDHIMAVMHTPEGGVVLWTPEQGQDIWRAVWRRRPTDNVIEVSDGHFAITADDFFEELERRREGGET
jgi:hypothetical protein